MDTLLYSHENQRLRLCRHGALLYNSLDVVVSRSLGLYGEYKEQQLNVLLALARYGQMIVEVGAHIGLQTVALAHKVGPEGGVIAIEPQRIAYQNLCANLALQSLRHVVPLNFIMGATEGQGTVPVINPQALHDSTALSLPTEHPGDFVPLKRLDGLGLSRLDLLVVDVEGGEVAVLEGARETLQRLKPIVHVDAHSREHAPQVITLLQHLGYQLWWSITPLFNPFNFFEYREDVYEVKVSYALIGSLERDIPELKSLEPVQSPEQWFEMET